MADTDYPPVLVEIEVPDPATDVATEIDAAFLHIRDRAVIGLSACQLLTLASTFDKESSAKELLKYCLHHWAAADVANAYTRNLVDRPVKA